MPTFPASPTTVPNVLIAMAADYEVERDLHSFMRGELLLPRVDMVYKPRFLCALLRRVEPGKKRMAFPTPSRGVFYVCNDRHDPLNRIEE